MGKRHIQTGHTQKKKYKCISTYKKIVNLPDNKKKSLK